MRKLLLSSVAFLVTLVYVDLVSAQQCCIYERTGGQATKVGCTQPDNNIICAQQAYNWSPSQHMVDPTASDRLQGNGIGLFSPLPAVCEIPTCVVNISLPVELTSFDASYAGESEIVLTWETASETNNAGFYVERQIGATDFEELGFVEGYGTTSEAKTYTFRVAELDAGQHVFRLKQVDFDGTFDYSYLVEATVDMPSTFVLEPAYPNPFNPSTTIRFGTAIETELTVGLYDASGKLVRTLYEGTPDAGSMQTIMVDGSGLTSGTYLVKLTSADFQTSQPIILLK